MIAVILCRGCLDTVGWISLFVFLCDWLFFFKYHFKVASAHYQLHLQTIVDLLKIFSEFSQIGGVRQQRMGG